MAEREVDVAVIGAGTAGLAAFRAARAHTSSVVLIEGGAYGTTCARTGCMPSKLLIAAADAAAGVAGSATFGVRAGGPEVDGRAVMDRLHRLRDRFVGQIVESVKDIPVAQRMCGHARFLAPGRLLVEGTGEVAAGRIVVATGSEPRIIPDVAGAGSRLVTNDDLFAMDDLPPSVAVFGAGVVGLELAQALHRLGVRVRLFGVGGVVGPLTDPAVVEAARDAFARAYPFDAASEVREVREREDGVEVRFAEDGEVRSERFDRLLAATGRKPALDGLALDRAGIPLDDDGLPLVDRATCQCGDSPVFVAGDATGDLPLLHEASDDGRVAGDNAGRFPEVRVRPRRTPLTVLFSRPEIALVGRTFTELDGSDTRFQVGEVDYGDQGRAIVMDEAVGLLRIYGEETTGRLLGAEMAAPAAEHLAHLLAFAVQRELTVLDALELPLYHPTLEEGLRTALRQLTHRLRMGPEPVSRCIDCGPGS